MSAITKQRAYLCEGHFEADDWEEYKDKQVKCIYCNKSIHIGNFGGIKQEGLFCDNTFCLITLIKEQEKKEAVDYKNDSGI